VPRHSSKPASPADPAISAAANGRGAALPRLALVPGEPAGVGPELALQLAERRLDAVLVAFADPAHLRHTAAVTGSNVEIHELGPDAAPAHQPGRLCVRAVTAAQAPSFGSPDPRNAAYLLECFGQAARGCMAGEFDAMVTGPVQKAAFNAAGIPFSGVTELLARLAGVELPVMMLANPDLRVALVTTHLPLRAVADAITAERLQGVLRVLHAALRSDFGIDSPRIAVLGLNPHAGEDGHLGREELDVIIPALDALRAEGMQLQGPLPADTAFLPQRLATFDAVLAMYHDQGLPVLKFSGFERAVNITLGLPFIRVAVDHGTALDLAGSGRADPSSLFAAADLAASLGLRRRALRSA